MDGLDYTICSSWLYSLVTHGDVDLGSISISDLIGSIYFG
ncbi:unnamed protein product [Acidithrix sp. C25]|nr:unnamed protein product [Acidithrix sp. C25]